MKRAILFLATILFCFALQAQDTEDSLAYLLGEPEPTSADGQAVEEIQLDDINADEFDTEEEAEEVEEAEYVPVAPDAVPGTIDYKAQKVSVRNFDEEKWKSIAGSTDYEEKPEKPKEEKPKENNLLKKSTPWNSDILRVVSFVLIIVIVVALLYYLLKNTTFDTKLRKRSFEVKDFVAQVENIEDLDIQSLLQKTLAAGDLRLAVRLYYLGLLKKLNDVGFITWKRDKTNRDYLSELFQKEEYFEDVKKLTLAYEQVWYGEHTIASESFKTLSRRFEFVDQKLNSLKPL